MEHPILKQSALRLRAALRWQELTTVCVRMHVKFKYSEGRQSKQHKNQMGGDIIPIKTCTLGTSIHTEYVALARGSVWEQQHSK